MALNRKTDRTSIDVYEGIPEALIPYVRSFVHDGLPADWARDRVVVPILRKVQEIDRMSARVDALPAEIDAALAKARQAREALREAEAAFDADDVEWSVVEGCREKSRRATAAWQLLVNEHNGGQFGGTLADKLTEKRRRLADQLLNRDWYTVGMAVYDEYKRTQARQADHAAAAARAETNRRNAEERKRREEAKEARQRANAADLHRLLGLNVA